MKRGISLILSLGLLLPAGCGQTPAPQVSSAAVQAVQAEVKNSEKTTAEKVAELMAKMTLQQKAAQMVQGAAYSMSPDQMKNNSYGSVLSNGNTNKNDTATWKSLVMGYQTAAMNAALPIPFVYGLDALHGHSSVMNAVVFPHNIGIGAANDEPLTYKMGAAVAEEMKLTGILWDFAPVVAVDRDPRWGRTYECYSSNADLVTSMGTAFAKGLLDHGIMPTAKHFIGDGSVQFGTGEDDKLIDRGDAKLTDAQLEELLKPYKALIKAGVKTIMVSHSSVNGLKMHANKALLTDKLKGELGFDGFIVSDWESIQHIPGATLQDQVILAVNSGVDMLMQPTNYSECAKDIVTAVNQGKISQERVDDAVRRILTVKYEMGLFDDPMQEKLKHEVSEVGTAGYRDLARQLVEKSLVLLKNQNNLLPLHKGETIFVTGPAADDVGAQCGGWTIEWAGRLDNGGQHITQGSTILDGLKALAKEYDLKLITDEKQAAQADITLLCVGEKPYAEWEGDTKDLSLTGSLGLPGNEDAIALAKKLKKPTLTLIVAGREVLITNEMKDWDSVVMCFLPGSEGDGIANVLLNKSPFQGKLPMPWYKTVAGIDTGDTLFPIGYGLTD